MRKTKTTPIATDVKILATSSFDVKITKEEIAEVVIVELKQKIVAQLDLLQKQYSLLNEEMSSALKEYENKGTEILRKYVDEEQVKKDLEKIFKGTYEIEFNPRVSLSSLTPQYQVILSSKLYSSAYIYLSLSDECLKEVEALDQEYRERRDHCQARRDEIQKEIQALNQELYKLPEYHKIVKAGLTRKALQNTPEGKEILQVIGKSLPITIPSLVPKNED
jgi:hypothetical protein